jgi:hypothetical protein
MQKVTLKIYEILALDVELNGYTDPQTGKLLAEGILSKDLKLTIKYWLSDLSDKVAKEKDKVSKLREEIIKKFGTQDEKGGVYIPMYINQVLDEQGKMVSGDVNPAYDNFQKEYQLLLEETVEVEYKELKLSDLEGIALKDTPKVFFKLIAKPESE